jgi:hypothetical protein
MRECIAWKMKMTDENLMLHSDECPLDEVLSSLMRDDCGSPTRVVNVPTVPYDIWYKVTSAFVFCCCLSWKEKRRRVRLYKD